MLVSPQRDNHLLLQISKDSVQCTGSFLVRQKMVPGDGVSGPLLGLKIKDKACLF